MSYQRQIEVTRVLVQQDKDALDCWSKWCSANSIRWIKEKHGSNTVFTGKCKCGVQYEIGVTIGGGMTTSKESYMAIKRRNRQSFHVCPDCGVGLCLICGRCHVFHCDNELLCDE